MKKHPELIDPFADETIWERCARMTGQESPRDIRIPESGMKARRLEPGPLVAGMIADFRGDIQNIFQAHKDNEAFEAQQQARLERHGLRWDFDYLRKEALKKGVTGTESWQDHLRVMVDHAINGSQRRNSLELATLDELSIPAFESNPISIIIDDPLPGKSVNAELYDQTIRNRISQNQLNTMNTEQEKQTVSALAGRWRSPKIKKADTLIFPAELGENIGQEKTLAKTLLLMGAQHQAIVKEAKETFDELEELAHKFDELDTQYEGRGKRIAELEKLLIDEKKERQYESNDNKTLRHKLEEVNREFMALSAAHQELRRERDGLKRKSRKK